MKNILYVVVLFFSLYFLITVNSNVNQNNETLNLKPNIEETNTSCFFVDKETGTITGYSKDPGCPKNIVIPSSIDGVAINFIGREAFLDKELTEKLLVPIPLGITGVKIPSSVIEIKNHAFYGNEIIQLTIPKNVVYIGKGAFQSNKISKLTFEKRDKELSIDDSAFKSNKLQWQDINKTQGIKGTPFVFDFYYNF